MTPLDLVAVLLMWLGCVGVLGTYYASWIEFEQRIPYTKMK